MALGPHHLFLNDAAKGEVKIELLTLKKADIIIRTLNHQLRVEMIKLLMEKDELTVTEIYDKLHLEQSVASQHLSMMRRAGIVTTRRTGKFIWYSVNTARIIEIFDFAKKMVR